MPSASTPECGVYFRWPAIKNITSILVRVTAQKAVSTFATAGESARRVRLCASGSRRSCGRLWAALRVLNVAAPTAVVNDRGLYDDSTSTIARSAAGRWHGLQVTTCGQ